MPPRTHRPPLDPMAGSSISPRARLETVFVRFFRLQVPCHEPSARTHRRLADRQLAGFGVGGHFGQVPGASAGVTETGEYAVFLVVGHHKRFAFHDFDVVQQRIAGRLQHGVPFGMGVGAVAVGRLVRSPAAAERGRLRLGRKAPVLLEIPAFAVLVEHDVVLGQRRMSEYHVRALFGHGDAVFCIGRLASCLDFDFGHIRFSFLLRWNG